MIEFSDRFGELSKRSLKIFCDFGGDDIVKGWRCFREFRFRPIYLGMTSGWRSGLPAMFKRQWLPR
jgi:hypothetical protein